MQDVTSGLFFFFFFLRLEKKNSGSRQEVERFHGDGLFHSLTGACTFRKKGGGQAGDTLDALSAGRGLSFRLDSDRYDYT